MFDTTTFLLASALAASGTVTVGYPSNRSQGNYDWSPGRHVLFAGGNKYVAPDNFTLTFNANASSITLTWGSGMATLAAGTTCRLQLDRAGPQDDSKEARFPFELPLAVKPVLANTYLIDLGSPLVADADGICASQSVSSGVAALLNGATVTTNADGSVTLDVARALQAAWTGAAVMTVTGKDVLGNVLVESSASGTSHTGTKAFKQITSVTFSANVTSATVGYTDVLGLPVAVGKVGQILAEFKNGVRESAPGGKVYLSGQALEAAVDAGTGLNFVCPVAGRIAKMYTIAQTGITTGGAVTLEVNTVAVDGLSVTVADSSAEGDVDSDTPTAEHATAVVAAGDRLEVQFAAGFNAASDLLIVIEIDATYGTRGTFVPAVAGTAPSATTGDVLGTYDPAEACDGDDGYMLLVALPDPRAKGPDQYDG